jgi:hypothetical protein
MPVFKNSVGNRFVSPLAIPSPLSLLFMLAPGYTLGFLTLFHAPFERAVNKLRYSIESIDENKFIVW